MKVFLFRNIAFQISTIIFLYSYQHYVEKNERPSIVSPASFRNGNHNFTLVDSIENTSDLYAFYRELGATNRNLPSSNGISSNYVYNNKLYSIINFHNVKTDGIKIGTNNRNSFYTTRNGHLQKIIIWADESHIIGCNTSTGSLEFTLEDPFSIYNDWTKKILYADESQIFLLKDSAGRRTGVLDLSEKWYIIYRYDIQTKTTRQVYKSPKINSHGAIEEKVRFYIIKISDKHLVFARSYPEIDKTNVITTTASITIFPSEGGDLGANESFVPLYMPNCSILLSDENCEQLLFKVYETVRLKNDATTERLTPLTAYLSVYPESLNIKSHLWNNYLAMNKMWSVGNIYIWKSITSIYLSKNLIDYSFLFNAYNIDTGVIYMEHSNKYYLFKRTELKIYIYEINMGGIF